MSTSNDYLEAIRASSLFEWTFALLVVNLTIQFHRLGAQLINFLFDLVKLTSSLDLFWPLTSDDLKPYNAYIQNRYETTLRFFEGVVLTIVAYLGASSLLSLNPVGESIFITVFALHCIIIILGLTILRGKYL